MLKNKTERKLLKELSLLNKKIDKLEKDMETLVSKNELDNLKKDLKKIRKYEEALIENTNFMNELVNELSKVKESHRLTRKQVMAKEHVSKKECEDRFGNIREALKDLEQIRSTHRKKASHNDLAFLRNELHDRMSQLEYQNKLLMKYLKKVDEILQGKE